MEVLMWVLIIVVSLVFVVIQYSKEKLQDKHRALNREIHIYPSENLGRPYRAVGGVQSNSTNRIKAEIEIMQQAKRLGADAIVGCNLNVATKVRGSVGTRASHNPFGGGKVVTGSTHSQEKFYFYGTAVVFTDREDDSSLDDDQGKDKKEHLQEKALAEIGKLKSLLSEELISNEEFEMRKAKIKSNLASALAKIEENLK